jgi:DNA repair protein RadC
MKDITITTRRFAKNVMTSTMIILSQITTLTLINAFNFLRRARCHKKAPRAWAIQMLILNDDLFSVAEVTAKWSKKPLRAKDRPDITSSSCIYRLIQPIYPELDLYESFWVMLLSRGNKLLGLSNISIGSVSGTVADPKKIFTMALLANASSIILIHNHPSGNLKPSTADRDITQKCKQAGEFLNLPVIDHIIISPNDNYFSFADEGLL